MPVIPVSPLVNLRGRRRGCGAAGRGNGHEHTTQCIEIVAKLPRIAHADGEALRALDGGADRRSTDGRLHDVLHLCTNLP
jgi:hypothetical protein